ncbi:recombinase family protein [Nonomuraea sp. NPDC005983]|uniref:recombinase family protein n=1 Tax=Nonomuraea sp. NPDC005983 TaxID=3155595 RepID=UPI0033A46A3F
MRNIFKCCYIFSPGPPACAPRRGCTARERARVQATCDAVTPRSPATSRTARATSWSRAVSDAESSLVPVGERLHVVPRQRATTSPPSPTCGTSSEPRGADDPGCIRILADKKSGKNVEREELWKALDYLCAGDTLVVPSLDRLGRSLQDLIAILAGLRKCGFGSPGPTRWRSGSPTGSAGRRRTC